MAVEQSQIQVDYIQSESDGPITLSMGASCLSGTQFTAQGGVTVSGVCTASQFYGDGSSLSNVSVAQTGTVIGLTWITV